MLCAISIAPFDPNQKVGYDPVADLAPVGVISSIAQVVIVKKELPVKSMAEFRSYAKANPEKLNYGSSGAGGLTHYSVELFKARTGAAAVHVPFKGGGQSTTAVIAGDVDFAFANMTDGLPQVQAGAVRGLAVTSHKRSPYLPELQTVDEAVLPGFVVETWNGIMAPAKTPEPIVRRLAEILIRMADDPEVREAMRRAGADTGQDHACRIPRADPAGDRAMETADRGDGAEEMIAGGGGVRHPPGRPARSPPLRLLLNSRKAGVGSSPRVSLRSTGLHRCL